MQSLHSHSPDQTHRATLKYEGEIRFGPPYYSLALDGTRVGNEVFGQSSLWSQDSRFFVVQQWLSTKESDGPQTALVCFDLSERRRCQVSTAKHGFIVPQRFEDETLIYTKEHFGTQGQRINEYEIDFRNLPRWKPM